MAEGLLTGRWLASTCRPWVPPSSAWLLILLLCCQVPTLALEHSAFQLCSDTWVHFQPLHFCPIIYFYLTGQQPYSLQPFQVDDNCTWCGGAGAGGSFENSPGWRPHGLRHSIWVPPSVSSPETVISHYCMRIQTCTVSSALLFSDVRRFSAAWMAFSF